MTVGAAKVAVVCVSIKIAVSQCWSHGQPARPNDVVATKHVQAASSKAKVLNNMVDLIRLFQASIVHCFCDDQVDINVGVNEITVSTTAHSTLYAHQTVLFGSLKNGFWFKGF